MNYGGSDIRADDWGKLMEGQWEGGRATRKICTKSRRHRKQGGNKLHIKTRKEAIVRGKGKGR